MWGLKARQYQKYITVQRQFDVTLAVVCRNMLVKISLGVFRNSVLQIFRLCNNEIAQSVIQESGNAPG